MNAKKRNGGEHLETSELAHIPTERITKRKQNNQNQTNQQADQNIAKPAGQQPGSPQLPKGPAAGAKP